MGNEGGSVPGFALNTNQNNGVNVNRYNDDNDNDNVAASGSPSPELLPPLFYLCRILFIHPPSILPISSIRSWIGTAFLSGSTFRSTVRRINMRSMSTSAAMLERFCARCSRGIPRAQIPLTSEERSPQPGSKGCTAPSLVFPFEGRARRGRDRTFYG